MPRIPVDQEKQPESNLCPCGCNRSPEHGHTYAGEGRAEQEAHRQRKVRLSKAQTRASEARQLAAHTVLARLNLGPASAPRVLAATLVSLVADVVDLASLVELDVAATDADGIRVRVGEHARAVRGLKDRAEAAEVATEVAHVRTAEVEVELEYRAREAATTLSSRDAATLEVQQLSIALAAAREMVESTAAALGEATVQNRELEQALSRADAEGVAGQAETADLRRVLSSVHLEAATAMAAQQAHLNTMHAKEVRSAVRRADDSRRLAIKDARARGIELQEQIRALERAARDTQTLPTLIISRR